MGGLGSGRHQRYARDSTESWLSLDVAVLARKRALEPGSTTTVNWSRGGHPAGSIGLQGLQEGLRLTYRAKREDGEWEKVRETIAYQWTATPFKGRRRWFACPGCGSRCRILYGGPRFRCRRCQGLSYESQYEGVTVRTVGPERSGAGLPARPTSRKSSRPGPKACIEAPTANLRSLTKTCRGVGHERL